MTAKPPSAADAAPADAVPNDEAPTVVIPTGAAPAMVKPTEAAPATPDVGPPRTGRQIRYLAAGAVVVLLVTGIGVAAYATAGDVPRGTTVLGADLGGRSRAEATKTLTDHLGPRTTGALRITLGGRSFEVPPASVGLELDVPATVDAATRGGPRLFGTREVVPVTRVDAAKLEAALRKQLDPKSVTMTKPGITYAGLTPKPTYPAIGLDLDPARSAELVRTAWLAGGVIEVPLVERPPATTREQVDALVANLATPAVSGPVTVTVDSKSFTLSPAAIAKGLVFTSDAAGLLTPRIDAKRLRAAAKPEFAKVEVAPQEASITLAGGKPKVVASTPGRSVDTAKLGGDLLPVLAVTGTRQVPATLAEQPAKTTDDDMAKLGVKEKVSTFTTKFPGGLSSPRSQNIVTIAKAVDGALVKPGATFSLNKHTGERTYSNGYKDAPVIVGGKLEPGVGGGASQFTTTLFNAAYYAGLEDVEHKPHSFYFDRYPAVIESTIFYPTLDLKFKNTTPYGILIDTSNTGSTVTVAMWSTKFYDSVKTERSPRRNITSPPTVYREPGPKCIATGGLPGFTQDAYRIIRKDGAEVKREKFTWKYDPEPNFICAKEPS